MDLCANILLVEDDPLQAKLIRKVVEQSDINCRVEHVLNGEQGLDYVYGRGIYSDRQRHPYPDLILLDILMPKVDGMEMLQVVKSDNNSKILPIIMLTGVRNAEVIRKCYLYGANAYVSKPISPSSQSKVKLLALLHLHIAELNHLLVSALVD